MEKYTNSPAVYMVERVAPWSFERENRVFLGMCDGLDTARALVAKRTKTPSLARSKPWQDQKVDNEWTVLVGNLVFIITRYRVIRGVK